MTALGAIGRILGHTLAGAVALPLAAIVFVIVIYATDSRCGSPGDSGGCEMGLAIVVLGAIPVGAGIGFLVGLRRVWRGRRR
jgi:hypothetical protein